MVRRRGEEACGEEADVVRRRDVVRQREEEGCGIFNFF